MAGPWVEHSGSFSGGARLIEPIRRDVINRNRTQLADAGAARLRDWGYVDIHCHCLPGLDDGPATQVEALALCRALVTDGTSHVIATPHQLGRFTGCNEAAQIREVVLSLNEQLERHEIALRVAAGADVRVDERLCAMLDADSVLTLADGGRYILLELPHEVLIDIEPLLVELAGRGVEGVLSHPERHPVLAREPATLHRWLECSAHLQVTAGSLLGQFGPLAEKAAWQLLSWGGASLVATDTHDLDRRRPCMKAAFERIRLRLGEKIARLVCIENPSRVLEGRSVERMDFVAAGRHGDA